MHLLLVEDNEDHALLTQEALAALQPSLRVHHARSGEEALDFVCRMGCYPDAPRPDLILLDVRLPGKSGFDVLETLKNDPEYRSIPIVMLTSSFREADVARGYALGTNMYIAKPTRFEEFARKLAQIPDFWLRIAALPGSNR